MAHHDPGTSAQPRTSGPSRDTRDVGARGQAGEENRLGEHAAERLPHGNASNRRTDAAPPVDVVMDVARESDAEEIAELVVAAYRNEAPTALASDASLIRGQRTSAEHVRRVIQQPSTTIVMARVGGGIAGVCEVRVEDHDTGHLGMLAVAPSHQSAGVGTRLRTFALELIFEALGCRTVRIEVLSVHEDLRQWYARAGFVESLERHPFPPAHARVSGLEFAVMALSRQEWERRTEGDRRLGGDPPA